MTDVRSTSLAGRARDALAQRDPRRALALLEEAEQVQPSVTVFLDKAVAHRMLGDGVKALAALDQALVIEPAHFVALLSKGAVLEQLGRHKEAVRAYTAAIAVAPPEGVLPPSLAGVLAKARTIVTDASSRLAEVLKDSVAEIRGRFGAEDLERFDESLEIYAGRKRAFTQQPLLFHYPRLPPIPFYDRALFPWLPTLEAATSMIAEELAALPAEASEDFTPYVAFPPGIPVNQWRELNHSRRWSTFFLWRNGVRQDRACALCPRTAALLASLPMAVQSDYAPTAMFSVLDARTRIPPHTGSTNTRLVLHLPLVLPGPAWFRVGNVTRAWRMGEAWVFDDTIEHEAANDADQPRTVLIFDVWNPFLSDAEKALVTAMMTARKAYEDQV